MLSADLMAELWRTDMTISGDGTRSGFERGNSGTKVDVTSAGVGTVSKGANNPILSVGEVLDPRQAVQLAVEAYGSLAGNLSDADMEEYNAGVTTNLEEDVEASLQQARAMFLAPEKAKIQRRQTLMMPVRKAAEQV